MPPRRRARAKRPIESYDHRDKERLNNPPVGLVTPQTDTDAGQQTYKYDPHLDPQLDWAGKAEHVSFEVPTVSLHVHERVEPRTIIEAVRKRNGAADAEQLSFFQLPEENPPLRQAIEFYGHSHNWSNRLIAGDSLLVMNSLLQKENLAGKVQMVYLDPPYGIRYGSNFQPFVNKQVVRDRSDDDLTQEPEQIQAFRDTWELGIHSYLTYLRDRLLLARELLTESGSVFVQISDENLHHVRELMDEVFGVRNFVSLISFQKKGSQSGEYLPPIHEYVVWYARDREGAKRKFRRLYIDRDLSGVGGAGFDYLETKSSEIRNLTKSEKDGIHPLPDGSRAFRFNPLFSAKPGPNEPVEIDGVFYPSGGNSWKISPSHLPRLYSAGRVVPQKTRLVFKRYANDFPCVPISNIWGGLGGASDKLYVVQTNVKIVARCMLMTTDPGDLVFDPTCGSGTTAYVAEQWGRRWITCDTSRVALTLAKQRLMTASFDYYELAHPTEGVGSGFTYKTVPHITLRSIANNPDIREGMTRVEIDAAIARHAPQETLYDQPIVDRRKQRVSGPFSVEAVPAPTVAPLEQFLVEGDGSSAALTPALSQGERGEGSADSAVARSGETVRQSDWRDELLKTGIRGKAGQYIRFARLEPLPGCRYLHADGETLPNDRGADSIREGGAAHEVQRVVVSFGPEHAPLEQRQVGEALEEAHTLVPRPKVVVFAAFQFDSEAAKDIDETNWPGMTLLKAQMNADLLTDDLKRKRASNESFWLVGQPDVAVDQIRKGQHTGKWQVEVRGFDYYNTKSGDVESGGEDKIAVWLLDTDYDGRSLYPRQVFFPMAGSREGWARLARNLKAEIDEGLIEAYRGTVSLPFEAGEHRRIAVKIVDDRGIESLKVVEVE